ncbi:MAG TPA: MBL fold metallo-hydrolase [Thermoprotei archaeon]|nr:MBL fold metallo-hydrolase [Thermoprotei archaeon]
MFEYNGVKIYHLSHAGFKIKNEKIIYIDPFRLKGDLEKADIIIATHDHFDHFSEKDIKEIIKSNTILIASENCREKAEKIGLEDVRLLKPGEKTSVDEIEIEAVPAYNIGKRFHPKSYNGIGVIINIKGVRIYHAGDTDLIPEMRTFKNIDIALLPVSGTYVMTAKEAVEAVKIIKPKVAIPMHYGVIVGSIEDARYFEREASKYSKVVVIDD